MSHSIVLLDLLNTIVTPKFPLPSSSNQKEPSLDLFPFENPPIESKEIPNSLSFAKIENKGA